MQSKTKIPTITLIGCGGAGINLIKKLISTPIVNRAAIREDDELTVVADVIDAVEIIDTCQSNIHDLEEGVDFGIHMLAEDGSGKNRATHIENIKHKLSSINLNLSDINIITFSMSGGSGSVIGPLLARAICYLGKQVMLVGVVDDCSKADCMNSIKTLQTIDAFARENDDYYPLMLYSNIDTGRFAVNNTVATRVATLINLLSSTTITEVDWKDKLNFLAPKNSGHAPAGVYAFGITDSKDDLGSMASLPGECPVIVDDSVAAHASMTIDDQGMAFHKFSNTTFIGYSPAETYYAINGRPISRDVIDALKKKADLHGRTEDVAESNMGSAFQDIDVKKSATIL